MPRKLPRASKPSAAWNLGLPWTTARLVLRTSRSKDTAQLVRILNDRRISERTTIPYPYTSADARRFLPHASRRLRAGHGFDLLCFLKKDQQLVGGIALGLRRPERPYRCAEVGYWISPAYWGQGLATEALQPMLDAGFRILRLHRIEAWCHSDNEASIRLLKHAGFREEGRGRESVFRGGRWWDRILFGLLASEYRARSRKPAS